MAELIDRRALLEKIWEQGHEHPNAYHLTNYATLVVREAPTIDAVPVVRCKDCKRCFKHITKRHKQPMWICMKGDLEVCVRPDDFCSYGERRGEDESPV